MSERAIDLIGVLDIHAEGWRDTEAKFDAYCEEESDFAANLCFAFFVQHPSWMDDVCPAVIAHQLEWIVQVMDNANACGVLRDTANSIYSYIKKPARQWLLEEEENAIAWG